LPAPAASRVGFSGRSVRVAAGALLVLLVIISVLGGAPPPSRGPSTYVVVFSGPQGSRTYDDSVAFFGGLARSGLDVKVLRYFSSIGVGGAFAASDATAEAIRQRLHPILLLNSTVVTLGPESIGSSQAVTGFDYFLGGNVTGAGVKVAVVDTGVDVNHPALGGAMGAKVVGGYNFVDDNNDLSDDDGHGTAVSGIIAGNSSAFKGVAPGAELLVYKVFNKGETSTTLIVEALDQASTDGAKVVNLSLGGGFTSSSLNSLGQLLYSKGMELVAAIGNDGPDPASAEAPGDLQYYFGVGSSVSLATTDPQAEVSIGGKVLLTAMPMNDTPLTSGVIGGQTVFIGNGKPSQVAGLNLTGRIAVSVRDHQTLFSAMEQDAANAGAIALVVVNDSPLSFTANGTTGGPALASNDTSYAPRIPVVAVSGAEGSAIGKPSGDGTNVTLVVFKPGSILYPAVFTSLGPSDEFSVKPEVLAPGDSVVAPLTGTSAYVEGSGTSFSTPQVSGTLALLAQLRPNITAEEAFSMVSLGATVAGGYFGQFPLQVQGAGVLNITRTLSLPFALDVHYVMLYPSTAQAYSESVAVTSFDGGSLGSVSYSGSYPLAISSVGSSGFTVTASAASSLSQGEDRLKLGWGGYTYSLPVRVVPGAIWVGYDAASGQIYSSYRGTADALVTIVRPDGTVLEGTISASHNFSLLPEMTGFYRVVVSLPGSPGSQTGRLIVMSGLSSQSGGASGTDSFPDFVPFGVIAFSGMVVFLAMIYYHTEAGAVRTEAPPSARAP